MENATKALLIAAGVLLAMMVVTLLIFGWNTISDYFQNENEETKEMQLVEFNMQFENYANDDIRGSDLLSLMAKIEDYNNRKTAVNGYGYKKMEIKVSIAKNDLSKFKYVDNTSASKEVWSIKSIYTQDNINSLINEINRIESKYKSISEASKLSSKISRFIGSNITDEKAIEELNEILSYEVNKDNLKEVKQDALSYYQITYFKRAHFKCTKTTYDDVTGRIIFMEYEFTGKFQ